MFVESNLYILRKHVYIYFDLHLHLLDDMIYLCDKNLQKLECKSQIHFQILNYFNAVLFLFDSGIFFNH